MEQCIQLKMLLDSEESPLTKNRFGHILWGSNSSMNLSFVCLFSRFEGLLTVTKQNEKSMNCTLKQHQHDYCRTCISCAAGMQCAKWFSLNLRVLNVGSLIWSAIMCDWGIFQPKFVDSCVKTSELRLWKANLWPIFSLHDRGFPLNWSNAAYCCRKGWRQTVGIPKHKRRMNKFCDGTPAWRLSGYGARLLTWIVCVWSRLWQSRFRGG